jgi:hypothetical protein
MTMSYRVADELVSRRDDAKTRCFAPAFRALVGSHLDERGVRDRQAFISPGSFRGRSIQSKGNYRRKGTDPGDHHLGPRPGKHKPAI